MTVAVSGHPSEDSSGGSVGGATHASTGNIAFALLVTYYWGLQFAMATGDQVARGGVLYFLYVLPAAAFSVLYLSVTGLATTLNRAAAWMAAYVGIVCAVAVWRSDLQTIASTVLFSSVVIVIFTRQLSLSMRLINQLFLASIVLNSLLFAFGRSIYSPIPGLSGDPDLWWRISLFPYVAPSAYFCLVVFFANLLRRDGPMRRTVLALSLYFLVFAGVRSALISGMLAGGYLVLEAAGYLRRPRSRGAYLALAVSAFVLSLLMSQLLLLVPALNNEFLNMYLFRTSGGLESPEDAAKTIVRTWLWAEHIRMASANPILGIGTFDFLVESTFNPLFEDLSNGSEAFLTGLYARVGLPVLLFLAAFLTAILGERGDDPRMRMIVGLLVLIAMLAYGSFVTPYDFVFLVMLGFLAAPGGEAADEGEPGDVMAADNPARDAAHA